jgi:hypothetical protein
MVSFASFSYSVTEQETGGQERSGKCSTWNKGSGRAKTINKQNTIQKSTNEVCRIVIWLLE